MRTPYIPGVRTKNPGAGPDTRTYRDEIVCGDGYRLLLAGPGNRKVGGPVLGIIGQRNLPGVSPSLGLALVRLSSPVSKLRLPSSVLLVFAIYAG